MIILWCFVYFVRPTSGPTERPTERPSDRPTNNPTTADPTPGPSPDPTPDPTPGPSPDPTPSPTPDPTSDPTPGPSPDPTPDPTPNPSDNPTPNPSDNPTQDPTPNPTVFPTPTCPDNSDYFVLGFGWELYLASLDESHVLSGTYDQDGDVFINQDNSDYQIWFEQVGTDYVFVVGLASDSRFQLYYKDLVSTWTDNDNPIVDSDDENEWDEGDETLEFVTSNMTLFNCEGENQGTNILTQYSSLYYHAINISSAYKNTHVFSAAIVTSCLAIIGVIANVVMT